MKTKKMPSKKPTTKGQKPRRLAPLPGSASVPLPICLLRMVVQVEDTPANRTALSVAKAQLLRDSTFDGAQSVVKMEQLAVISLCKPNDPVQRRPDKAAPSATKGNEYE